MKMSESIRIAYDYSEMERPVDSILNDIGQQLSDEMRGRYKFDDFNSWYDAYCILAMSARLKPHGYSSIRRGDYPNYHEVLDSNKS